ncbi:MAG: holo-[acyl-carrier-protein] synthase [Deltaproteobacteria bacterium GWA2_38_16]|nr:MAG: holo-[acyl-carrier-protein] synthase [Deltaproteobacteria bacterium GWA2_38_16]OGQ03061.1 MAG: holo-[acyl-carrier-protein] synthase [Deltaproteobacteria bacterium RIFCSPHIGHO2_02_FULL_38_15]OGQ34960.1 MAG: holo-[acyl-carrier-protein] synthase [Deltaproteobacteria bacterium RIFCSPLOWO2_01_FULL_38_9]OGQ61843.1 MAG: holo-[acyl-carrier-protein] synthase [Deltaproteobacteria bacterium RIFCSPLOWO2_12_FULL_38_8]HBQ20522.1 holo-[acyl-carrier-protein] synthase [Deltaproteobacteria bacterium]
MIIGHGVDIVSIPRMHQSLKKQGDRFLKKIFTEKEIHYCQKKAAPSLHFAARFSAKEACLKALQTGFSQGMYFKDISIEVKSFGAPVLKLTGSVLKRAKKMGANHFFVSLSHEKNYAIASVILTK